MNRKNFDYFHVDVFSSKLFSGNGLAVVYDPEEQLTKSQMQQITREFKQFETIFIIKKSVNTFRAYIFTVEEELDFAGHPILGAVATIHQIYFSEDDLIAIELELNKKTVSTISKKYDDHYYVEMDQGGPEFLGEITFDQYESILQSLNLKAENIDSSLPFEVVSTGLPYLLIPVKSGLENASITSSSFSELLTKFKAKFVYVFDRTTLECRTWDNIGLVEDVATGSAAGPLCAYLIKHNQKDPSTLIEIHQGSFVNRPSIIYAKYILETSPKVVIAGEVVHFASGKIVV